MRLALARALFCKPDLLLADEVTNYLDFPAVVWLENYLINWPATLLVVSHDRSFLNAVATDILYLHHGNLDYYRGSFNSFVATVSCVFVTLSVRKKTKTLCENMKLNCNTESIFKISLIDVSIQLILLGRYNANRAAQAQSKIKILEKLPPLEAPPKDDMEGMLHSLF